MRRITRSLVLAAALCLGANTTTAQITNGSFETGDFAGWVTADSTHVFFPLDVYPAASIDSCFLDVPTDGDFYAGGDLTAPFGCVRLMFLAQDVTLGSCDTELVFDWRVSLCGVLPTNCPTRFHLVIEEEGGGGVLQLITLFEFLDSTFSPDSGLNTTTVDVSAFSGSTVHIRFLWQYTVFSAGGLRQAFLDNVRIVSDPNAPPVASGLPPGNVFTTAAGQTLNATISFDSPEVGQTTSVVVDDGGLANFGAVSTPGNPASVDITFSPDGSQIGGSFPIVLTATDDGCPAPETTIETIMLDVSCFVANATPMGTPCGTAGLSATLPIFGSMGTISIDGTVPSVLGSVFQTPNSGSSFLFQGCEIFVSGLNVLTNFTTDMEGNADIPVIVPADTMLCGLERVFQALVLSGIGPVTGQGIEVTNAVVIALGATP